MNLPFRLALKRTLLNLPHLIWRDQYRSCFLCRLRQPRMQIHVRIRHIFRTHQVRMHPYQLRSAHAHHLLQPVTLTLRP
jgi:hypothetical protein